MTGTIASFATLSASLDCVRRSGCLTCRYLIRTHLLALAPMQPS